MTTLINDKGPGPMLRGILPILLVATAMVGALAEPVAAAEPGPREQIEIAASDAQLNDARSLARIRRQVSIGARALCDTGGIASLYRNGARRCRERVVADAERQIAARMVTGFADGAPNPPGTALNIPVVFGFLGLSLFMAHATR